MKKPGLHDRHRARIGKASLERVVQEDRMLDSRRTGQIVQCRSRAFEHVQRLTDGVVADRVLGYLQTASRRFTEGFAEVVRTPEADPAVPVAVGSATRGIQSSGRSQGSETVRADETERAKRRSGQVQAARADCAPLGAVEEELCRSDRAIR